MHTSIAKDAISNAKKLLLLTIIGANMFVLLLVVERVNFYYSLHEATAKNVAAEQITAKIHFIDQLLTSSTRLAATTGDKRWVERYKAHLPAMEDALKRASALASEAALRNFQSIATSANDSLVALEERAFALIEKGDLGGASAVLDSPDYASEKLRLNAAADELTNSILQRTKLRVKELERWSTITYGMLIFFGFAGALTLWKALSYSFDRSERTVQESENKMRKLAMFDSLTGLTNRFHFEFVCKEKIEHASHNGDVLSLLAIDLDRFKYINDTYGHEMGDNVLKEVSERIRQVARRNDLSARCGGDEFVVMLCDIHDRSDVDGIAQRIIGELRRPIVVDDKVLQIGASVGAAFYPTDATSFSELMRKADVALYRAKNAGRGAVKFFSEEMDVEISQRYLSQGNVRSSIDAGEFVPYFQPIIDLKTAKVYSLEMLVRWRHPVKGLLSPNQFLERVTEFNLINEMALSLLRDGCDTLRRLPFDVSISLNIAARQIQDRWFVERVFGILRDTGVSPSRLIIEVTEGALINDFDTAREILRSWQDLGIRVAIDDFGTGYSSLTYLSKLPFDELKVDQSFIRDMKRSQESLNIVKTIISLSRSLNIKTVAEGVETREQMDLLSELGCDMAQGYFYSRPVPRDEIANVIDRFIGSNVVRIVA